MCQKLDGMDEKILGGELNRALPSQSCIVLVASSSDSAGDHGCATNDFSVLEADAWTPAPRTTSWSPCRARTCSASGTAPPPPPSWPSGITTSRRWCCRPPPPPPPRRRRRDGERPWYVLRPRRSPLPFPHFSDVPGVSLPPGAALVERGALAVPAAPAQARRAAVRRAVPRRAPAQMVIVLWPLLALPMACLSSKRQSQQRCSAVLVSWAPQQEADDTNAELFCSSCGYTKFWRLRLMRKWTCTAISTQFLYKYIAVHGGWDHVTCKGLTCSLCQRPQGWALILRILL